MNSVGQAKVDHHPVVDIKVDNTIPTQTIQEEKKKVTFYRIWQKKTADSKSKKNL